MLDADDVLIQDMLESRISPTQLMHPPRTQNSTQDSNDQAEANMTAADQGDARLTMARRAARQIIEILSRNAAPAVAGSPSAAASSTPATISPFPGHSGSSAD